MFWPEKSFEEKAGDDPATEPLTWKQKQIVALVARRQQLQQEVDQRGRLIGMIDAKIEELSGSSLHQEH